MKKKTYDLNLTNNKNKSENNKKWVKSFNIFKIWNVMINYKIEEYESINNIEKKLKIDLKKNFNFKSINMVEIYKNIKSKTNETVRNNFLKKLNVIEKKKNSIENIFNKNYQNSIFISYNI